MPTIIPNQTFKHEGKSYEKDTPYEVSEGEAYYFKMCGWTGEKQPAGEAVTLEVHDSELGHASEVK